MRASWRDWSQELSYAKWYSLPLHQPLMPCQGRSNVEGGVIGGIRGHDGCAAITKFDGWGDLPGMFFVRYRLKCDLLLHLSFYKTRIERSPQYTHFHPPSHVFPFVSCCSSSNSSAASSICPSIERFLSLSPSPSVPPTLFSSTSPPPNWARSAASSYSSSGGLE